MTMTWVKWLDICNYLLNTPINPTLHGGGPSWPTPQHLRLWSLPEYSEEPKILVQFLIHSDNCYAKCLEPKGFPKKNLEYIFWSRGQKSKLQKWKKCPKKHTKCWAYQKWKTFVFWTIFILAFISKIWLLSWFFRVFLNFVFLSTL